MVKSTNQPFDHILLFIDPYLYILLNIFTLLCIVEPNTNFI